MRRIETNIYPIENLEQLKCRYHTYEVKGLSKDVDEYYTNIQSLTKLLSFQTKSPCFAYSQGPNTFIAQPTGHQPLPTDFNLVRTPVKINKLPGEQEINFKNMSDLERTLAVRFMQFYIQSPLHDNPGLWQPRSGYPFFHKNPDKHTNSSSDVVLYRGFAIRVVSYGNGLGLCIDPTSKYVARNYLPTDMDRDQARRLKGMTCLYEYGDKWYEIRIEGLNDLKANECILPNGQTLYDFVMQNCARTQNVLASPKDSSVLIYKLGSGEIRNALSGLCRLIYGTDHPHAARLHKRTMKNSSTKKRRT